MKKVLISGAGGALGREMLRQIAGSAFYDVYALSSRPERLLFDSDNITAIHNREIENLVQNFEFDFLIHLAFPRNTDGNAYARGIDFTYKLYDAVKDQGHMAVIHVSSQSIYGLDRRQSATESTPAELSSVYTTGKYCTERTTNLLFAEQRHTNVRLATLIGKESTNKVPNIFLRKLLNGDDVTVRGGNQLFSFLDVRDAAAAIIRMMDMDIAWEETYNLGTSESYNLLELAHVIRAFAAERNPDCGRVIHVEEDVYLNNTMDSSLFYENFLWTPRYSMTDSLEYILE